MTTRRKFFSGRALEVMRYQFPYTDEPLTEAETILDQAITAAWIWACMEPVRGKAKRGYRQEYLSKKAVKLLIYRDAETETCEDIQASRDRGRTYHCPLDDLSPPEPP